MTRTRWILSATIIATLAWTKAASAEKLELAFLGTPTFMHDKNTEAVSSDGLNTWRFGVDLRTELLDPETFSIAPLVSYRFGADSGYLTPMTDTEIATHDLLAGVRLRRRLLPWLTLFGEVEAGAQIVRLDADMGVYSNYGDSIDSRFTYTDRAATWSAGILVGVETHLSRPRLEAKGNDWFCFGGELAFGYLRHGNLEIDPTLDGGGDTAITTVSAGSWGDLNLSGFVLQAGVSLYFF
jgi:hypothetical protein